MARTGRRPGRSGTREAILAAARSSFAARGYDATTIRGVAGQAGVDPALVSHYFGAKDGLFAAMMEIPRPPAEALAEALEGEDGELGRRIVATFLSVWDSAHGSPLMALLRSATGSERAASLMREFAEREIVGRIARRIGGRHARLRASLVASHMLGLGLSRYVIGIEPAASAPSTTLVDAIGPRIQAYLFPEAG
jgi:AcrR family transcriptional regulator